MFDPEEDFEMFAKGLGPAATNYTLDELRRLDVEVQRMADFLLELSWKERRKNQEVAAQGIRLEPV